MNPDLSDANEHRRAMDQIPWYVNGTLEPGEVARLAAHLEECTQCRNDYEAQARLSAAMQADGTLVFAAEPSFQKLMARIGDIAQASSLLGSAARPAPKTGAPARRRVNGSATRWLAAAVVLETLGLGYGAWAWHVGAAASGSYVTLTSSDPSYRDSPRVRIVFRSGLSVQGLGVLLQGAGAHIIDGPTAANVYTLGFAGAGITSSSVERRAAALRANADVLFAEPQGVHGNGGGNDPR